MPALSACVISQTVIFVTLLTNSVQESREHSENTERWVQQLLCLNVSATDIMVLVTDDVDAETKTKLKLMGVHIREVTTIKVDGTARYERTTTKIYLWTLVEYDKVVYYDSDMWFFKSPSECVCECLVTAELCVVADPAGKWPHSDPNYFNSGFMILKPSMKTFELLRSNIRLAQHQTFGDQDLLNNVFSHNHHFLPSGRKCNFLHAPDDAPNVPRTDNDIVAVHEKVRHMQGLIPSDHWLRSCVTF